MTLLTNPFNLDRPENLENILDGGATCLNFNRGGKYAGSLLATGRFDGFINIWDLFTMSPIRIFEGHVKAISNVSWSLNSRYLLSASRDWNCIIWDLKTRERSNTIKFDAPIHEAYFHPQSSKCILVTLSTQQTFFVELSENKQTKLEIGQLWQEDDEGNTIQRSQMTAATFSPSGNYIYGGTAEGNLLIFELPSLNEISKSQVCNGAIKHIATDRNDWRIALTSKDRTARVVDISKDYLRAASVFKFSDEIDKTHWNDICFSNDSEYIIGGSGHKASHIIYIWESTSGSLIKVIEGPRDPLHKIVWHPNRPIMASVSSQGNIFTWSTTNRQRWAAFAPGFEELETNVLYSENEDEFDIYVNNEAQQAKQTEALNKVIDIDTSENDEMNEYKPDWIKRSNYDDDDDDNNYLYFPSPNISDNEDEY